MLENLTKEFNQFFHDLANIEVVNDRIEITIGTRTLLISLPEIVGGQNCPKD
jgi:hypothetical protein